MTDYKLKPCPFCGHTKFLYLGCEECTNNIWMMYCQICHKEIFIMDAKSKEDAVKAWNRRYDEPKQCCANCVKYKGRCTSADMAVESDQLACLDWVGKE